MYAIKTFSVLALAATAFAAPTPVEGSNAVEARAPWRGGNRNWYRPESVTVVAVAPEATETAVAQSWAPAETAAPAAPATGSISSGGDWLAIANKWRSAGGLSEFTESSQLVANALKTSDASVGGLTHQLNPGTFAQVLAPGDASNFESVYVGGWLCELPNSAGLNGICDTASQGWNHGGQTGHAEILTGSYKSIGCALSDSTGVWACDFA